MAVSRGMMGLRCSLKDTTKVWNTWRGTEKVGGDPRSIWTCSPADPEERGPDLVPLSVALPLRGGPSFQQLFVRLLEPVSHLLRLLVWRRLKRQESEQICTNHANITHA